MIRIDEIYCNTFLPVIQDRPFHSMHWFTKFGSVNIEDLCSMPVVSACWPNGVPNNDVVRFLFWDQEPLHKDLIDKTLTSYRELFHHKCNPKTHIIISEYSSEMAEYIQDTYGFIPHYYFFHGWAAMDWFRGYNHSFLIKPPEHRCITKTFISPNRIVAGARQHRLFMLYHIFKMTMDKNWISCPAVCPAENVNIVDAIRPLARVYADIEQVFAQQSFPINFPDEHEHPMKSASLDLFNESAESLLYLVTETVATGRRQHLTEKTFKPICLSMPFVLVSCAGSLQYLRNYGFQTFGDLWDESYDEESNDIVRYEKISQLLKDLDNLTTFEKQQLFNSSQKICKHNYDHFYGGGFEKILWNELKDMLAMSLNISYN